MQFKNISIRNFRVFVDEELSFSQHPERNVTVLHGQNGSGKTTVLNALRWALYGNVQYDRGTDSLPHQGRMSDLSEGEILTVETTLEFEDDGTDYEVHREQGFQKRNDQDLEGIPGDQEVTLSKIDAPGAREEIQNPTVRLEQLMPERLSSLFLFDGEYINRLSGMDDDSEIKNSIQNIMGLEILERAIRHLESVQKRFEDEMKESGSDELEKLTNQKQEKVQEKSDIETALEDISNKRERLQAEIDSIDAKLSRIEEVADLVRERNRLTEEREELKADRTDLTGDIKSNISDGGYLPFAMGPIEETAQKIDELRQEGKIPSELENQFVEKLLHDEECICGRPLQQNSEPHQLVAGYKNDTPDAVDTAALQTITRFGEVEPRRDEFFGNIESNVSDRSDLIDRITAINERVDELGTQIQNADGYDPDTDESPEDLEQSRDQKLAKRAALKERRAQKLERKATLESEIDELEDEIDDAQDEKREARLARKRKNAAQKVRAELKEVFDEIQQKVRSWSNDKVRETFSAVARKSEYEAHITEEFELEIRESVNDTEVEVQKSRGERQISSLAFIGSLVSIAKQRYDADSEYEYFSGGVYPIVMDSPFGALDKQYRRQISRIIPELANQVIVMVTDSQWEGPVENEMSDIAGEEYVLDYQSASDSGTAQTTIARASEASARGD